MLTALGKTLKKFDTKEVFEAEVKDVVKGGLVVDIGVRGFIPASLVEAHFVEDFTDYKGKTSLLSSLNSTVIKTG